MFIEAMRYIFFNWVVWLILLFWYGVALAYSTIFNNQSIYNKINNAIKVFGFIAFIESMRAIIFMLHNVVIVTPFYMSIIAGLTYLLGDWTGYFLHLLARGRTLAVYKKALDRASCGPLRTFFLCVREQRQREKELDKKLREFRQAHKDNFYG